MGSLPPSAASPSWRSRAPVLLVWGATLVWALLAATLALRRHDAYLSGYDLAGTDQELWLLTHGHRPLSTLDGRLFWGEHVSPTLLLLAPLYMIGAGATTLLVLQAATVAAVAPILHALARSYGAQAWLAIPPALLWLASPFALVATLDDVHHVALVAPVIAGSVLALRYQRLVVFAALALLACGAKEDVSLTYVMLGLVVAVQGRRRLGAVIGGVALAMFVFATAVVMPAFSDAGSWYVERFAGDRGDSLSDVAVWMVGHPFSAAGDLAGGENVVLVLVLLLSTGGLCLLAPLWMVLGAPALAHNVLSAYPPQHALGTHYALPVALSFSIASAVGVHRMRAVRRVPRLVYGATIATAFLAFSIGLSVSIDGTSWSAADTAQSGGAAARRAALDLIPRHAVVTASNRLAAHLSHRVEVYAVPLPFFGGKEYGVDWSSEEMARRAGRVRWVAIDTDDRPNELPDAAERLIPVMERLHFRKVYERGSIRVYRRDSAVAVR